MRANLLGLAAAAAGRMVVRHQKGLTGWSQTWGGGNGVRRLCCCSWELEANYLKPAYHENPSVVVGAGEIIYSCWQPRWRQQPFPHGSACGGRGVGRLGPGALTLTPHGDRHLGGPETPLYASTPARGPPASCVWMRPSPRPHAGGTDLLEDPTLAPAARLQPAPHFGALWALPEMSFLCPSRSVPCWR